jgi:hypothetical protein
MADNCVNYNCDDLGEYDSTLAQCGAKRRTAGAATMYLLECGITPTDPGDQDELDALVTAGTATMISNVKIGFGQPAEITSEAITSCGTTEVINYTRTFTLEDGKVTLTNTAFWNQAKKRVFNGAVLIECPTSGLDPLVTFIDAELSLGGYRDFPNTNEQIQKYVITGSWKALDDPLQYDYTA